MYMALEHPHNAVRAPAKLLEGDRDHGGCISPQLQAGSCSQQYRAHQGFPLSEKMDTGAG